MSSSSAFQNLPAAKLPKFAKNAADTISPIGTTVIHRTGECLVIMDPVAKIPYHFTRSTVERSLVDNNLLRAGEFSDKHALTAGYDVLARSWNAQTHVKCRFAETGSDGVRIPKGSSVTMDQLMPPAPEDDPWTPLARLYQMTPDSLKKIMAQRLTYLQKNHEHKQDAFHDRERKRKEQEGDKEYENAVSAFQGVWDEDDVVLVKEEEVEEREMPKPKKQKKAKAVEVEKVFEDSGIDKMDLFEEPEELKETVEEK